MLAEAERCTQQGCNLHGSRFGICAGRRDLRILFSFTADKSAPVQVGFPSPRRASADRSRGSPPTATTRAHRPQPRHPGDGHTDLLADSMGGPTPSVQVHVAGANHIAQSRTVDTADAPDTVGADEAADTAQASGAAQAADTAQATSDRYTEQDQKTASNTSAAHGRDRTGHTRAAHSGDRTGHTRAAHSGDCTGPHPRCPQWRPNQSKRCRRRPRPGWPEVLGILPPSPRQHGHWHSMSVQRPA